MKYIICLCVLILIIILTSILFRYKTNENFYNKKEMEMSPKLSKQDIINLKKGQIIMTKLFKEFDRICRKYNLKYWCVGGTLIGAIRHKGWVPYDGDIDVGMLEEDYKILVEKIEEELPKNMWFQTSDNDKYWNNKNISKIRSLEAFYKRKEGDKRDEWHNGLQLDILLFKNNKKSNKIIHKSYGNRFNKDVFFPLKETLFEDINVYIPNKSNIYLTTFFKNYDVPLPIHKRIPHEGLVTFNQKVQLKQKYSYLYFDKSIKKS